MVARQTQERTNARAACRGSAGAQPSFAMPPRPKTHELRAFLPVRTVTRREMCGERAMPLASVGPRADVLGKRACLAAWRARAVAAGRLAFSLHGPARQTFPPAAWHMPRRRRRWRSRVRRFDDTYGCRLGSSVRSSPCKREPGAPWRRRPVAPASRLVLATASEREREVRCTLVAAVDHGVRPALLERMLRAASTRSGIMRSLIDPPTMRRLRTSSTMALAILASQGSHDPPSPPAPRSAPIPPSNP